MKTIMCKRFVLTSYYRYSYNFNGIKRGRGDRGQFYGGFKETNCGDDDVDQTLGRHLKRKHLRYDSNFYSFLESWSDKDDWPIIKTKIEELKDKIENPLSQIIDIGCIECLGYSYVECECLKGKMMTVESSTNVGMVLSDYEKKHED